MNNTINSNNHKRDKTFIKFLLIPVIIIVITLLFGILLQNKLNQPPKFNNATLYPTDFRSVPTFKLQDQHGQIFTQAQLKGKWSVIFFGFTYCPDVCPTTLNILQQAYSRLGKHQKDVQVILISVDPQRDNQQQRKDYIEYFNPNFIALGEADSGFNKKIGEKTKNLTKSMYIHYALIANETNPEDYSVDHSTVILIINPDGRRHAQITPPIMPSAIAQDINTMIEAY